VTFSASCSALMGGCNEMTPHQCIILWESSHGVLGTEQAEMHNITEIMSHGRNRIQLIFRQNKKIAIATTPSTDYKQSIAMEKVSINNHQFNGEILVSENKTALLLHVANRQFVLWKNEYLRERTDLRNVSAFGGQATADRWKTNKGKVRSVAMQTHPANDRHAPVTTHLLDPRVVRRMTRSASNATLTLIYGVIMASALSVWTNERQCQYLKHDIAAIKCERERTSPWRRKQNQMQ